MRREILKLKEWKGRGRRERGGARRAEREEREEDIDEALIAQRQSIRLVSERSWVRTPVRALL